MKLHGDARTCPHSRLLMVRRVEEEGWTPMRAAEAAGVSVRTVSKWLACWRADGEQGLSDRSWAPGSIPHRTPERRVGMIVTLRRLGMTAAEIAECLSMPASTVSAVLTRIGLGRLSRLERPEAPNRYERRRAGELLHIDVKKLVRIAGAGHRVTGSRRGQAQGIGWEFVHIAIDDATRIAYVEVLDEKKATTAVGFLRRAVAHFATYGPRSRLPDAQNPPPAHQALPTTNERQGRALHPHAPWRLGLRCDLRKLNRADTSAHRLAQLLQSHPTTRLPRPPTATRATRGPHEQRGWVLQLGAGVADSEREARGASVSALRETPVVNYQSELMIGAAGTAVTSHFSSHSASAGSSCQLSLAFWKWSATPASVS